MANEVRRSWSGAFVKGTFNSPDGRILDTDVVKLEIPKGVGNELALILQAIDLRRLENLKPLAYEGIRDLQTALDYLLTGEPNSSRQARKQSPPHELDPTEES